MGTSPYATTVRPCCRASRTQPGRTTVAKTAISSAAAGQPGGDSRGRAPAGLHQRLGEGSRDPNAKAEPIAKSRPSRKWSSAVALSSLRSSGHLRDVMSKMRFGHDITAEGS